MSKTNFEAIAAAVLIVFCVIVAIFRTCGKRGTKKNTGYSHNADMQRRNGNVPLKRKSAIVGSAGAISARGWRNAGKSARDSRRTGCALPRA